MKTREIDVWICPMALSSFERYPQGYNAMIRNNPAPEDIKAKLIIEVPEKKITISESEFCRAFEDAWMGTKFVHGQDEDLKQSLKQKLFGSDK